MTEHKLQTLTADTPSEELAKILKNDGCLVLKDFASKAQVESLKSDLQPFIEATMESASDFGGFKTTRTGALMARSPQCRELAIDPRILGIVESFLGPYANNFQLHVTQVIRVMPGEKPQMPHRDRWAWSQLQDPSDLDPPVNDVLARLMAEIEPQLNIMMALTDFTKENGATRVAPGSTQLPDNTNITEEAFVSAEMTPGSMLVFTGSVFHGAGANTSQSDRIGLAIDYTLGWLRQEDNQYLSCPPEIAKDLDPKLQALLGYAMAGPSLGYFTPPLPAGEDLNPPQKAFQWSTKPAQLGADGRLKLTGD